MVPDRFAGMVEPVFKNDEGLMVACTVSCVTGGRVYVKVMNVAIEGVVLHKGVSLAIFQTI